MANWKPNCEFYFEDHFRGREQFECRLLSRGLQGRDWTSALCRSCPVPRIRQANRCPTLILEAQIESKWFRRQVAVTAFCTRAMREVEEPMIGCGQCHDS